MAPIRPSQALSDSVLSWTLRHVVPVYLHFEKSASTHTAVFTSTVISVRGHWMLLTAGHCIRDVEVMLKRGYRIARARLIDSLSGLAWYEGAIPFDYEASSPIVPFSDGNNDYGLMFVDDFYRRQLEANGIRAIDEEAWDKQPTDVAFAVAGVAGQLSETTVEEARLRVVFVPIKALEERPACFEETGAARWYAAATDLRMLKTLEGLSGGPVFAYRQETGGQTRYWLHGIQSAQSPKFPGEPFIAAMLARPLGNLLAEIADKLLPGTPADGQPSA